MKIHQAVLCGSCSGELFPDLISISVDLLLHDIQRLNAECFFQIRVEGEESIISVRIITVIC